MSQISSIYNSPFPMLKTGKRKGKSKKKIQGIIDIQLKKNKKRKK